MCLSKFYVIEGKAADGYGLTLGIYQLSRQDETENVCTSFWMTIRIGTI